MCPTIEYMWATQNARRSPRHRLDSFCTVVTDDTIQYANVLNLSEKGILIERPYFIKDNEFGLELELPQIDELLWFKARHSHFRGVKRGQKVLNFKRGLQIVGGASRHLKLVKEFVFDQKEPLAEDKRWSSRLMLSSRWLRG